MKKCFCQMGMITCLLGIVLMLCAFLEGTMAFLPAMGCAAAFAVAQYGFGILAKLSGSRRRKYGSAHHVCRRPAAAGAAAHPADHTEKVPLRVA